MIEYSSIANSAKSPRDYCIAFDKLDGSNCRFKYTPKQGFNLYGTRTQLISEETPFWNRIVLAFDKYKKELESFFKKEKEYRDFREIIVFGEFVGPNSFAGRHHENEEQDIIFFDVLCGHKNRKLVLPQDFIKEFSWLPLPKVIYEGNLNEEFIKWVRENQELKEGVICKYTKRRGDAFGGVKMCKIKTQKYLNKLQEVFGVNWKDYWE